MWICTCNNCGETYEDMNPGVSSIDYPEEDTIQLAYLEDKENGGYYWGCPLCLTDGYLVDNKQQ